MKRFYTLLIFTVLLQMKLIAQSVSYTTSLNDPSDIRNFQIHLVPFYMDMSRANLINMGWEVWGTADIKKRIRVMTSFRKSYFEMNKPPVATDVHGMNEIYTKGNIGKSWKFEAIGQLNFANYTRNKSVKVVLEQYTSGYGRYQTTHTKYLMVPGLVGKSFGIRGGVYNLYTPVNLSETKGLNGGQAFYGVNKQNALDTVKNLGEYNSMNSMVLAAGINMRTVVNLVINTDTYGTKSNRSSSDIYLDLLVAMYNNYRNVYKDSVTTKEYDVKPYGKRPFGWRFGWQFTNPARTWMSMKMEFGKRPEWQSKSASGFFFDFNFGINIPFRVKTLE